MGTNYECIYLSIVYSHFADTHFNYYEHITFRRRKKNKFLHVDCNWSKYLCFYFGHSSNLSFSLFFFLAKVKTPNERRSREKTTQTIGNTPEVTALVLENTAVCELKKYTDIIHSRGNLTMHTHTHKHTTIHLNRQDKTQSEKIRDKKERCYRYCRLCVCASIAFEHTCTFTACTVSFAISFTS